VTIGLAGGTTLHGLLGEIGIANGRTDWRGNGRPLRISIPPRTSIVSPGRPMTRLMKSISEPGGRNTATSPRLGRFVKMRPSNDGKANGKLKRE
jgi:hypothetical protein